jgi:hypothetical protein
VAEKEKERVEEKERIHELETRVIPLAMSPQICLRNRGDMGGTAI